MAKAFRIQNLQDIESVESIPIHERIQENNTYEAIRKGVLIDPDKIAISFLSSGDTYEKPVEITYRELLYKIHQCANMLHDMGIGPKDVVTFLLPNMLQTHFVIWGAEIAGIVNPINPLLEASSIRDLCNAAETKVLIALGEVPGTDIWSKVLKIKDQIPTLKCILSVMGQTETSDTIHSFDKTLNTYPGDALNFERTIAPDDIASLYHTGGTTGTPKLAKRTHFNEVCMAWIIAVAGGVEKESTIMGGLPLFHVNGATVTGLTPLSLGAHLVMLSPGGFRDPSVIKNFYKIVDTYKANFFSTVPTVLAALMDVPVEENDISSLEYAFCGAAPLSVEMFDRFQKHSGMEILEAYGLTEGTCGSSANPLHGEKRVGSIGLRMVYQEMKTVILNDMGDYERDAKPGEIGAVAIKGPNVFKGYLDENHNKDIWLTDGWFNTGDMGRQDEDGYFWLTGRKKELIIRGGHNIDPGTIEEALYQVPDVQVVAAIGQPDPYAGELPVAYVQLKTGSNITEEELLAFARENVGERAAIPKRIIIVKEIPLTPVGKIFKPALRWANIKQVYEQKLAGLTEYTNSYAVNVGEDKTHGTRVDIKIRLRPEDSPEAINDWIKKTLGGYTLHHKIVME